MLLKVLFYIGVYSLFPILICLFLPSLAEKNKSKTYLINKLTDSRTDLNTTDQNHRTNENLKTDQIHKTDNITDIMTTKKTNLERSPDDF